MSRRPPARRDRSRGQSLVEFSVLVPAFMLLLFGMLEFGFVFTHNLTLEYATREGARTGAALADGNQSLLTCNGDGTSANPGIDAQIIAAVERVLNSPGSPISSNMVHVTAINIWRNDPANPGIPVAGTVNTWTYSAGNGPPVDTKNLDFIPPGSPVWKPCTRNNGASPDSIGVSLTYDYQMVTPLSAIARFFGGGASSGVISMADRTVMALNP